MVVSFVSERGFSGITAFILSITVQKLPSCNRPVLKTLSAVNPDMTHTPLTKKDGFNQRLYVNLFICSLNCF